MVRAITFCATGRTGVGHLRRVTNIAHAMHGRYPAVPLNLLTNATVAGLTEDEVRLYVRIDVAPRPRMAEVLASRGSGPVVVDTAFLAGLDRVDAPLCLVLRETVPTKVAMFRLDRGRAWDLLIVPNPAEHWLPEPGAVAARRMEAVGWIYRQPSIGDEAEPGHAGDPAAPPSRPQVLVASGGGGTDQTADRVRREVERLIGGLRRALGTPIEVVQALGPRAPAAARIVGVDRILDVGARLHDAFARADLIVSTAGYNSVLEIACTAVPTLLVPIPRSLDDQEGRARRWECRLGRCYDPADPEGSIRWMTAVLDHRQKRRPADLGPSGAMAAAELIEELLT